MSVCRRTSRVYCDVDDLDGVLNALNRCIEGGAPEDADYYTGARRAIEIIRNYEHVDTQETFVQLLELDRY